MIDTNHILYDLVSKGIKNNHRFICSEKNGKIWLEINSEDFLSKVQSFAVYLHSLGVKKSDKIALHSENRIDWLIADLGITAIGGITIPIYTSQSLDQIDYILNHSETKILIVSDKKMADKYNTIPAFTNITTKISLDNISDSDFLFFDDLILKGKKILQDNPSLFDDLKSQVTPNDIVSISYTSGTTGTPKGVTLSHKNLAHAIQAPLEKTFLSKNLNPQTDTVLSFLPFTHVFEHCAIYGYLTLGIPVYILADVERLQSALEVLKPVHFTTVPRVLEKIYQTLLSKATQKTGCAGFLMRHALQIAQGYQLNNRKSVLYFLYDKIVFHKIRQKLGGNLRGITSGGAAMPADVMRFFYAIGIPVGQGYGLTETSPGLTLYDFNQPKLGAAGKAFEGVTLKIAEDGEILAKGDNIMQGYFKEADKTTEVIDTEGWFHTGDIGHIDLEGFLFITDRKKELFKLSTGKYVAPSPLENLLVTIAGVDNAIVVGENQKFCGALIIPIAGYDKEKLQENLKQGIAQINKSVSPWEAIKQFVISQTPMTIESGELTPTHKKKRKIIMQNRQSDIDSLFV